MPQFLADADVHDDGDAAPMLYLLPQHDHAGYVRLHVHGAALAGGDGARDHGDAGAHPNE